MRDLVLIASSGGASEYIGTVQNPHPSADRHVIVALVGTEPILNDIACRLDVPLFAALEHAPRGADLAVTFEDKDLHRAAIEAGAERGMQPATLVHADATIGPWVDVGVGCMISPGARVTGNVRLGRHCQLHTGSIVSHDGVLADYVTLSPGTTLCGGVTVGARSTVFAGATVMPDVTIGSDATVGAGALVNKDVGDGVTVVGVPAKPLG
ncbi:MAG: sugar O-acyltransferase (sialic acid O-acetyltransferase NeuD family) [Acidimicrobiales bacterium]|jgi:sugar O-acyltransferase (sialic acid O-acetyltransferase NeuD family)